MLLDIFLDLCHAIVVWVLLVLPSWEMPIADEWKQLVKICMDLNHAMPIQECLHCITLYAGAVIAHHGMKWTIKIADWIMDVIP